LLTIYIIEAIGNLASSKLRSALAILGILVGTASVVAMVSSGQLATEAALLQFKSLGTNLLSISLYDERNAQSTQTPRQMTLQDARQLPQQISPAIQLIAPYTSIYLDILFQGKEIRGSTIGSTENLQQVINLHLAAGRFISDLDHQQYYAVVGHDIYQQLDSMSVYPVIGSQLRLGDKIVTIIGALQPWAENSFFNENINNAIIVPLSTAQLLSQYAEVRNLVLRIDEESDIDTLTQQLTQYMQQQFPSKRMFMRSAKQIIQSMLEQRKIYTILLGLIGSISLLVGGIGIMNIMLVSVVERKREIGIRKAIGARDKDIRMLFLIESVILSLFGGICGVLLGVLVSYVIATFANWQFSIFLLPILIGFGVSAATGIFFGFYPAYKASLLDPIEALRSD
jgi:putative ABC transport system permease protein